MSRTRRSFTIMVRLSASAISLKFKDLKFFGHCELHTYIMENS